MITKRFICVYRNIFMHATAADAVVVVAASADDIMTCWISREDEDEEEQEQEEAEAEKVLFEWRLKWQKKHFKEIKMRNFYRWCVFFYFLLPRKTWE